MSEGKPIDRKSIWSVWVLMSALIAVLVSIGSMVYWDLSYVPSPDYNWRPIDELLSVLMLMPFGWFIAVVVFGLIWPWYSVAMQGI